MNPNMPMVEVGTGLETSEEKDGRILKQEHSNPFARGDGEMVRPEKVFEEFAKKEDENYSFRAYLKSHADSDELDTQFLRLHEELFARMTADDAETAA